MRVCVCCRSSGISLQRHDERSRRQPAPASAAEEKPLDPLLPFHESLSRLRQAGL